MASFVQTLKFVSQKLKMLFLSKITILHIFDCFGYHTTKKKNCHTRRHKLQPNTFFDKLT